MKFYKFTLLLCFGVKLYFDIRRNIQSYPVDPRFEQMQLSGGMDGEIFEEKLLKKTIWSVSSKKISK
jgi:hypothetical protein